MKAAKVSYRRVSTLAEALESLAGEADARVLSGGQSLLPMLNMRLLQPDVLVDIGQLSELRTMRRRNGVLLMGSLVTYRELERSPVVTAAAPLLAMAVGHVGDIQVRNRGTVGGSIAQGDPTAELPLACLTLDGQVTVISLRGSRRIRLSDFLLGPYETALARDELVTEVEVQARPVRSAFAEATRRHNDFAIVSAAATGVLAADGGFQELSIGLGGVADTVMLAARAAAAVVGHRPDEDVLAAAAEICQTEISPISDTRASADYRRHLAGEYLRRVVLQLAEEEDARAA
jgi:aerobic carbon-monoxide dehydrogenase medium subunit